MKSGATWPATLSEAWIWPLWIIMVSHTASTSRPTCPTGRCATTITLRSPASVAPMPSRRPRSTTGMTTPRRLITPRT